MTISTEVRKAGPFIGNGSASAFPFAFKVFKAADLIVVRRQDNIGEETTLVLDSDYHVTLNGNQDTTPGGVVTLVAGALASGFTLVVSSELPYLQPTDLTNQGGFYPKVITNALDRLTIFCQQLAEITGRTLKLPITAPTNISAEIPLPNPSELIAWNETGTGLTTVSPQSLVTSIAYGSATADLFAGDGVTTTFPLSTNPASVNNLDVSIGGHSQRPVQGGVGDYSWNGGASITFVTPPPAPTVPGDKNVLVRYMQAIPVSDSEALHAQTREALRRSYAEAGYNLVDGSFETGGTLTAATDVMLQESTGAVYAWAGVLPKVVAPGTDPTADPLWVPRTDVTLREYIFNVPFGDESEGVFYRPGTNYESAGTVAKPETRPWYHDFRPIGVAQGGDAIFSTDGGNMFLGPGAGNFTMRPLAVGSVPPGVDYNLQCSHNIAYGIQALGSLTIGYKNTGLGTNAFRNLTEGHGNTAAGRDCGHGLTVGNDNAFYGFTAAQLMNTGNYNCVFGVSASYKNTDGSGNSVYGRRAAFDQTAGDYNQFFGEQAGYGFLSGSYNTFIGKQSANNGLTQGDSNLVIGSRITGLQDEKGQVIIADGNGKKALEVHKDPVAAVKKASYLDLPSYEVTAFNAAATDGQVTAGSSLLLRSLANAGNAVTQIVFQSRVGQPFSRIVSTAAGAGQMVFINDNVERLRILSAGGVNPGADNTQPFGSASKRWSELFAGTGTINTSDAREKTAPLPIDDVVLDAWGDVQLIAFQWLSSVAQKGDSARWHFGVIAQQVRDAFIARGLDGTKYGLLCYDEWEDEFETDEKGTSVQTQVAGNRWGIRPDQCLFLEAAYQRRRCDRIESRLEALETK